jgi:hypothetical protein
VIELGMPMVDLARKFDIIPAAVSYAVQRGEKMAKEWGINWRLELFDNIGLSPFSFPFSYFSLIKNGYGQYLINIFKKKWPVV